MKVSIKTKKSVLTLFIVSLSAYLFCQSTYNNTRISLLGDNLEALSDDNNEYNNGIVINRCYSSIETSSNPSDNDVIYLCNSETTMHLIPKPLLEGDKAYPCIEEYGNKDFGAKIGYCFIPNTNN